MDATLAVRELRAPLRRGGPILASTDGMEPTEVMESAVVGSSAFERIVGELRHAIESEGNVRAIFGEPIKLDQHVVVPVMSIEIAIGGGGGYGGGPKIFKGAIDVAKKLVPAGWGVGGGGGFSLRIRPVGFIRDQENGPSFVAIAVGKPAS